MKTTDHRRQPELAVIPHIQDKTEQLSYEDLELKQRNLTLYNDFGPASKTEAFGRYELHQDIVKQRASSAPAPSSTDKPSTPPLSSPLIIAGLQPVPRLLKLIVGCSLLGGLSGFLLWLAQSGPHTNGAEARTAAPQVAVPQVAVSQIAAAQDVKAQQDAVAAAPASTTKTEQLQAGVPVALDVPAPREGNPAGTDPASASPTQAPERQAAIVKVSKPEKAPTKSASTSADKEANASKKQTEWARSVDTVRYAGKPFPLKVENEVESHE